MHKIVYLLFLFVFATQAQTKMSETEANILREMVKTHSTSTQTISSDFVQYNTSIWIFWIMILKPQVN